jgi:hypothetical protein
MYEKPTNVLALIYIYICTYIYISYSITDLGRPSLGLQEVEATRISRQSAYEDGKVVSSKYRPSLPQGKIPGTHFF